MSRRSVICPVDDRRRRPSHACRAVKDGMRVLVEPKAERQYGGAPPGFNGVVGTKTSRARDAQEL